MSTPEQIAKHPDAQNFFLRVAAGDEQVLGLLWSIWNFSQAFDDLVDGVPLTEVRKEQVFKATADFITNMLLNPFVMRNSLSLHAMMLSGLNRWLDGDKLEAKKDPSAPYVRCGDIDLFLHIAFLHKGWAHMRSLERDRVYDTKD